MKKIQKAQKKSRPAPFFTLDRDAGLVVSMAALLKEGVMKRQFEASKRLFEANQPKEKAKASG